MKLNGRQVPVLEEMLQIKLLEVVKISLVDLSSIGTRTE